ncbi:lyase family protein [Bilophila wadsworthia]|uniref:aspartate ammonia-lyase n=1 Tax=Bilophila wadsworthia TaxID=35833 RepID=UPI00399CD03F
MRIEKDALGEMPLPDGAYYGIQAFRSLSNFDVTDKTFNDYPAVVRALAEIKKACALANRDIGALGADKAGAIARACDDILEGRMEGQFPVNIWRGGGTSINMNLNEVIANRANELLTGHKGYEQVHPNTHVNMCQSSNDVYPTAENIVLYRETGRALEGVAALENSFARKSKEFGGVVRLGRTCLQDGVPMTPRRCSPVPGSSDITERLEALREGFRVGVLGGTVIGTGLGVLPGYVEAVYPHLSAIVGFEMRLPDTPEGSPVSDAGLFDAMQNADGLLTLSGALKVLACSAGKIANDFRLLSSGPRSGFGEIRLPAVAPGSSIMPGKINPFMCDLVVQIMHQVAANDWAITMNASASDLDLASNATVSFFALLQSLEMIGNGFALFSEKCVEGIVANEAVCRRYAEESTSLATIVSTLYGYETGSRIAGIAYREASPARKRPFAKNLPEDAAEESDAALAHRAGARSAEKYGDAHRLTGLNDYLPLEENVHAAN